MKKALEFHIDFKHRGLNISKERDTLLKKHVILEIENLKTTCQKEGIDVNFTNLPIAKSKELIDIELLKSISIYVSVPVAVILFAKASSTITQIVNSVFKYLTQRKESRKITLKHGESHTEISMPLNRDLTEIEIASIVKGFIEIAKTKSPTDAPPQNLEVTIEIT